MALLHGASGVLSCRSSPNNNTCPYLPQTSRTRGSRRRGRVTYATSSLSLSPYPTLTASSPLTSALSYPDSESSYSAVSVEKLESLLFDSIAEIVRSIRDAPFVRYVYERARRRPAATVRRVSENSWPVIKDVLNESSPDCVILVQKVEPSSSCPNDPSSSVSEVDTGEEMWGVVVEGKSAGVSACYILKTTQVPSAGGRCTHFCISRANCFSESPPCIQFSKSWLQ